MPDQATDDLFYFNGINGDTGAYNLPPMSVADLAGYITGEAGKDKPENLSELRYRYRSTKEEHLGVKEGVDPKCLDQTGWGLILANDADPAILEALTPLLQLRKNQAGGHFRIYEGQTKGHRPDESKSAFLARHGAGPGPADPDKVPYYLLICGSPERIPYRFQSQLDVQYAVGRIHFETLDEYANYARSLVEAETRPLKLPRQMRFFGVANPLDRATGMSAGQLVGPLRTKLCEQFSDWTFDGVMADDATKARLGRMLGGDETPSLLFTASHGMGFPLGSPRQLPHQGALLCQDWPGPSFRGPIPEHFYFAGTDLASDTNLLGLIAFFFACYGAGTPQLDDFAKQAFKERAEIAPKPFMAQLPTRMLGLPRGGALAVIGHVERAWTYSFKWKKAGTQTEVFRSTLHRLLEGHPVGSALEFFNERYAELSTVLNDELEEIDNGKQPDVYELADWWTANNDARGYALIGDPAARLPVVKPGEGAEGRRPLDIRATVSADRPAAAPARAPEPIAPPATDDTRAATAAAAFAAPGQAVPGRLPGDPLTIVTYRIADPADEGSRTLAVRTRVAPNGDMENLVAEDCIDAAALLDFHRGTLEEALAARRGR